MSLTVTRDADGWHVAWGSGPAGRELDVEIEARGLDGPITLALPPVDLLPAGGLDLGPMDGATRVSARVRPAGGQWSEWVRHDR